MKSICLILTILISLNLNAKENHKASSKEHSEDHTSDICSSTDAKICAHIGHMNGMKSKSESSFKVHVMIEKPITNLKVELWMPEHDHGTNSPVVVAQDKGNKYDVTKAVFSMPGKWVARLNFEVDKIPHKIEIPLIIEK